MRLAVVSAAIVCAAASGASAQLVPGLPRLPDLPRTVDGVSRDPLGSLNGVVNDARAAAAQLARERSAQLQALVREHPELLELTREGPAVRGEILVSDASPEMLATLSAAGFAVVSQEQVEGLGFTISTLRVPLGMAVDRAVDRARRLVPELELAPNHLHLQSGSAIMAADNAALVQRGGGGRPTIGMIDGGVGEHPSLQSSIQQRGFASGGLRPSQHGTAVASLIAGQGAVRGAAPGARLLVADIYGSDPAGGSAANLVRALGWMVQNNVRVVATSLVGPNNPLVARAVQQARRRGTFVVAPVGNSGAAAPPAYPASYPEAIAVTAVDGRGRVLIEAGRSPNLTYAAPGADMIAARLNGQIGPVRGTSFAVPLVAGRLARHLGAPDPIAALDREASPRERRYGRGLICGACRTPIPRN
jgi:minor extracellular protease Epr